MELLESKVFALKNKLPNTTKPLETQSIQQGEMKALCQMVDSLEHTFNKEIKLP